MTNEEAIECNKNLRMYMKLSDKNQPCKFLEENYTALDMAIKALEQEPRRETVTEFADRCRECGARYGKLLKQQPCEDAISRQAVMNLIRGLTRWCVRSEDGRFNNVGLLYDDVMFGLDKLPPVTPQPKMGRWLIKDGREQGYDIAGVKTWYIQILCSECGFIKTAIEGHTGQYHYCPNCGAKMQEVEE